MQQSPRDSQKTVQRSSRRLFVRFLFLITLLKSSVVYGSPARCIGEQGGVNKLFPSTPQAFWANRPVSPQNFWVLLTF